jgi:hypothetical protein
VLYAIDPADMSIWATLRCPQMLSIYLLLLFPYYGVSLWMMLLLLVCIDWRCDYQLINYIVLIRALSFITVGLSWTCQAVTHTCIHTTQRTCAHLMFMFMFMFMCAWQLYHPQGFIKFEFCVNNLEANPDSCDESGPGSSEEEVTRFAGIASKSAFVYCMCHRLEPRTTIRAQASGLLMLTRV